MKILKLPHRATVEDLLALDEKAELVNGQIVLMGKSGGRAALTAARIWKSLEQHQLLHGGGVAYPDGVDFIVNWIDHAAVISAEISRSAVRSGWTRDG